MSRKFASDTEVRTVRRRAGRPRKNFIRAELLPTPSLERHSYIDSIRLTLPTRIPPALLSDLKRTNGVLGLRRRKLKIKRNPFAPGYLVHIPQPCVRTLEILDYLQESLYEDGGFEISRVDVALDLLASDRLAADSIHRYLVARLRPRHMRINEAAWVFMRSRVDRYGFPPPGWHDHESALQCTSYLGFGTERGARVAIYSTRPTKVDDQTRATRLEWRVVGAAAVRSAGLDTTDALRQLDHREFWDQRLRLLRLPAGGTASRREWTSLSTPIANLSASTGAQSVSHGWMLPARENAIWDATWSVLHSSGARMISAVSVGNARIRLLGDAYQHLY